jgi:FAD/FMN-containing dehydrogenase
VQYIKIGPLKFSLGANVNDVHSQLNRTWVSEVVTVRSLEQIQETVRRAGQEGKKVSIAGGRHAMGGQQFGAATVLLDMTEYKRVLAFDSSQGVITVEAGIQWTELIEYLVDRKEGLGQAWGIIQKQTGADNLTIGGALSSNIHGRGLKLKPFIADVESFLLVNAFGQAVNCSRHENAELFRLAIGGYGLFGVIATVNLRLARRQKVMRKVELIAVDELIERLDQHCQAGSLFGDFQFSIDETAEDFLTAGILSTYSPVHESTPIPKAQQRLSLDQWNRLVHLAHSNRRQAFNEYCNHYLSTDRQVYWSDTHQLSTYLDGYHERLHVANPEMRHGTELITEIYIPREHLADFLLSAASYLRQNGPEVIYGTVRLIEQDQESFLAWAKESYACIIFNLHTAHTQDGIARSARAFRHLISLAIERGGSFYLTYHKFATIDQVLACYPQFLEFLKLKQSQDPDELFESNWYRHYKAQLTPARSRTT